MVIAVSLMVMFEGDQAKKESLLVQELKPDRVGCFVFLVLSCCAGVYLAARFRPPRNSRVMLTCIALDTSNELLGTRGILL